MEIYRTVADLEVAVGRELGPTEWFAIDQTRIDGFADATEDHQWIHVDPAQAAAGPFGATVAHGFLTLSLLPYFSSQLRRIEGARMGINYGLNKVRFPAPVRVGSRLRARAILAGLQQRDDGSLQLVTQVTLEAEGQAKPVCVAELVGRYYLAEPPAVAS